MKTSISGYNSMSVTTETMTLILSHYKVTHVRTKNSNIQGKSPTGNVVIVIFNTIRDCSKRKEFAPYGSKFLPL